MKIQMKLEKKLEILDVLDVLDVLERRLPYDFILQSP